TGKGLFGLPVGTGVDTCSLPVGTGLTFGLPDNPFSATEDEGRISNECYRGTYLLPSFTATTPYEAPKPKSKSDSDSPVSVHLYRSMIGPLMYLTASRPVKKIFKYLKGQPKLGLWYPKESPLVLEAYSDSDYAGENKERKSTTDGCQFLGRRLISWQCKKQTIVATSSTKAEYVAAANCCGQAHHLSWLQLIGLTITEDLVRSRLQLADDEGVANLPIPEIYSGMDNLGYMTKGKLTFLKNKFSPQWMFLVHTLLHCLSLKFGSWDQFGSPIAIALIWNSMPLLPAMLLQAQAVLRHDHSSDQHKTTTGSFPTREDAPLGGDFHTSPTQSSHAPPTGQPSGGVEDPITQTALSSVVSTLVQKVHSLETELHDHKKLFKDVMRKLVKKVKTLDVKLKTQKRKMVVSDSDQEDGTIQNVDLDALRALANAAVAVDSDIPFGSTSQIHAASPCAPTAIPLGAYGVPLGAFGVSPGASGVAPGAFDISPGASVAPTAASAVPADSPKILAVVPADSPNVPVGVSNKGKSPMVEEDIPITARTFRQMEEDRLGEEATKRLHDEEMAHMERERAEA
nr:putative ribonuclease H-like domain-containing protein [Tanacetum cinerariifolium]